jgi:uncharacterized protein
MPQISQAGRLNSSALVVPDLYVEIVSPQARTLNGVPSNVIGLVGVASWGPVGRPVVLGSMAQFQLAFGTPGARRYDLGSACACAVQQGATAFCCVRVSDGTDQAATYALLYNTATGSYPVLLTALYSGSAGNTISVQFGAGAKAGTWRLTLQTAGLLPEVFDNLGAAGGAASVWSDLVAAVNFGQGPTRGPSQLCVATAGQATTTTPVAVVNQTLLNGSDGIAGVTAASLVGQDAAIRNGMYALRGQGCAIAMLADCDDPTQWTVQAAFGEAEGCYMILTGPSGDTIADAIAVKQSSGLDSYACKLMFGDWLYWYDPSSGRTRLVSPQAFVAGRLANLSVEQSSLNKSLASIIGSQRSGLVSSGQSATYSTAELQTLFENGIDVVCNPAPGGAYWAVRGGFNTASSNTVSGDNYTRLTNYIAQTLSLGMGAYVGSVINANLLSNIRSTLLNYLSTLLGQGILGSVDGSVPYAVVCDATNNPQARTALGYVQADVQVRYQGINERFLVNLQGGQNVAVAVTQNS